jgi:hypothetical protein
MQNFLAVRGVIKLVTFDKTYNTRFAYRPTLT